VQDALKALRTEGLIEVHARFRQHAKPIVSGGKVLGTLKVGTRTSNAYTFAEPKIGTRQKRREATWVSKPYGKQRDVFSGRWVPAPTRSWIEAELMRAEQPGHGVSAPLLVAARERAMSALREGRKGA
jgi:hypothetical protein